MTHLFLLSSISFSCVNVNSNKEETNLDQKLRKLEKGSEIFACCAGIKQAQDPVFLAAAD